MILFPHPLAYEEERNLVAFSTSIYPELVEQAYKFGYFPWYMPGGDITFYYTKPRMILHPKKVKIQKSMRTYFNNKTFTVTYNQAFDSVIRSCMELREHAEGTWISEEIIAIYQQLFDLGKVWSVEVWDQEQQLVGGLYGVVLGKIFYGESMFHKARDASKFALISLCHKLEKEGFLLIDCQQETDHLKRMGAEVISGARFWSYIRRNWQYQLET